MVVVVVVFVVVGEWGGEVLRWWEWAGSGRVEWWCMGWIGDGGGNVVGGGGLVGLGCGWWCVVLVCCGVEVEGWLE